MGSFVHLSPEERRELLDNIVTHLEKRLEIVVAKLVGQYAITEEQVAQRVQELIRVTVDREIENRLRFKWLRRLFFK